ncbi:ATP-binding protein [candidate division KSB1 bacterium]
MKRKIIKIDESLCDGCGECIVGCSEGALVLIDGKAKLVKENFCDGFGDCVGTCPTDALTIEEREADEFDLEATLKHVKQTQGEEAAKKMVASYQVHMQKEQHPHSHSGSCPGSAMRDMSKTAENRQPVPSDNGSGQIVNSPEMRQWPVQIHLVPPTAPFFKNRELVVMNTCGPIASADVQWRYIRGRSVVVGCPKLDDTRPYAQKLGAILSEQTIPKVIVVRMEVPCCGGLSQIAAEAVSLSGRNDIVFQEDVIKIDGSILSRIIPLNESVSA